ncbi:MAG: hypothetical protein IPN29_00080 [Saprospiraceae bacterium]|nr:hypothetical protein [Saprospiraceae bacterium]
MRVFFLILVVNLWVKMGIAQHLPVFAKTERDTVQTLYCQLDYQIPIKLHTSDPHLIEVKAKPGTVVKLNDSLYQVRYVSPEEEVKIKLYYKNMPVDLYAVKVANLPMPVIRLSGLNGSLIPKGDLAKVKKFELEFPYLSQRNEGIEFFTCRLSIVEPGKPNPFYINLRTPDFPQQLQGIISKLPANSTLSFDELKVKTRSNNVMNMDGNPVKFTVVE